MSKHALLRHLMILSTVALCAYWIASGVTRLVADAALPVPAHRKGSVHPKPGSSPSPSQLGDALLSQHLFQSTDPDSCSDCPPDEGLIDTALSGDEPPFACDPPVRVVGAMVRPHQPELSFASLESQGQTVIARRGEKLGGYEVLGIREQRVFLRGGPKAGVCEASMFAPTPGMEHLTAPPRESPRSAKRTRTREALEVQTADGITRVSDSSYRVTRAKFEQLIHGGDQLMSGPRVAPVRERGQVVGLRLSGIRPSSVLMQLGLQNGDTLRTINGLDISDPDKALTAYASLQQASHFTLTFVRAGVSRTLDYRIE